MQHRRGFPFAEAPLDRERIKQATPGQQLHHDVHISGADVEIENIDHVRVDHVRKTHRQTHLLGDFLQRHGVIAKRLRRDVDDLHRVLNPGSFVRRFLHHGEPAFVEHGP